MRDNAVAVLVPVLGRPHRVAPLAASIHDHTPVPVDVVFIADPDDTATHQAVNATGCRLLTPGGTYAQKINLGVRATCEPLVFFAADDLEFRDGWLENAARMMVGDVGVVGVNDLIERQRDHATHFLVARWYAESPTIDGELGPLHEGYRHWYVDDEFIQTAIKRRAYAYADIAHVAHLHPMNGKAPDDETYRKGRAASRLDRRTFRARAALWT